MLNFNGFAFAYNHEADQIQTVLFWQSPNIIFKGLCKLSWNILRNSLASRFDSAWHKAVRHTPIEIMTTIVLWKMVTFSSQIFKWFTYEAHLEKPKSISWHLVIYKLSNVYRELLCVTKLWAFDAYQLLILHSNAIQSLENNGSEIRFWLDRFYQSKQSNNWRRLGNCLC